MRCFGEKKIQQICSRDGEFAAELQHCLWRKEVLHQICSKNIVFEANLPQGYRHGYLQAGR